VEAVVPVTWWKGSLEQQGEQDIVGGANQALGLDVLAGGVGTQHLELNTVREEESAGGGVIKILAIVTLNANDGASKLRGYVSKEVRGKGVGIIA
jgi:hypothetical protein